MLSFIKNLFASKPAETVAEVPYKVEVAVVEVTPAAVAKPAKAKKPAVKKATTAKPRKPKTPKAPK